MSVPLPESIGRYTIRGLIGRGGMGTLYLAWDPKLERDVALKLLREGVDSEEMLVRFTREARSAARLRHPHIVTIFDVGEHQDRPYIAMEYVTGQTLAETIRTSEPMSVSRKIELLEELCAGLGYAHRQGIVHRDIKPANLMVDSEGVLKILDFGIARVSESMMTQSGVIIGTLNYMSPEQVAGNPVDPRSDIFAVGAVAYELFTYRMAFPGNLQSGILHRILHTAPEPLSSLCPWLDPAVVRIVQQALNKTPESRFPDLKTMREELVRARQNLAQQSADSTAIPPPDPRKRTRAVSTPAHSNELKEIERRRQSQIESWLDKAAQFLEAEDFAAAVTAAENALMLDAGDDRALSVYADARARQSARQATELANEAEQHLERGALTLAEELVQKAIGLSPRAPAAIRVQEALTAERQKQEEARRQRELIESGIHEGSRLLDAGELENALAALEQVLRLAPDHPEAAALHRSTQEAIEARERRLELARARDAVSAARAEFAGGRHDAALTILRSFGPPHELVTATLDELTRQHAALVEQARVRQAQLDLAARALANGDLDAAEGAIRAAENAGAEGNLIRTFRADLSRAREEAAQRAAAERAERERQAAIAAALTRADQATELDHQIAALRDALRLAPDHADVRRRLDEAQRLAEQRAAAAREQERRTAAARALVERAAQTASHADAVALLREAVVTDSTLAAAAEALATREQALEAEIAQRRERERRRDESRQLVDRAAQTEAHAEAIRILRQALAIDGLSGTVKAKLSERETALQAQEAAAAAQERRRKDARRLVVKAAKTADHTAAIGILRQALALDKSEAQLALTERERAQAAEIAAEKQRQEEKKRQEAEAARRAADEEKRRREEEAARQAVLTAMAAEEKKRQAAEAEKKRQEDEAARRAAEEEQRRREEEAARQAVLAAVAADEKKRQAAEEERKRQAAEAEKRRQEAEAEKTRLAAAEEQRQATAEKERQQAAADQKRREASAVRRAAAQVEQLRQEEEAARRAAAADVLSREPAPTIGPAPALGPAPAVEPAPGVAPEVSVPQRLVAPAAWHASPVVRLAGAAAVLVLVIATAFMVWGGDSTEQESELLPIPSVPTTVVPPPIAGAGQTTETPQPPIASSTIAPDAGTRAATLRQQAERLLPSQPAQALQVVVDALRLQPGDRASQSLLNRVALAMRTLASQAQARASGRTANPTYQQAQRASQLAEGQLKQGNVEAAARGWLDARAGFERAATEPPQIASATTSTPVQVPAPTTVAPAPTTVPVPTSVPVSPPTSVPPAPTSVPTPARNDQALIQSVLAQYAGAYSRLDVEDVVAVYPGLDVARTRNAFSGLRALQMTIENAQIAVTGDTASVTCTVRQVFTPRVGRGTEARTPTRFDLARRGDRWIITARQ